MTKSETHTHAQTHTHTHTKVKQSKDCSIQDISAGFGRINLVIEKVWLDFIDEDKKLIYQ